MQYRLSTLCLTEKAAVSFITLYPQDWQMHSYVACCGTTMKPVLKMLQMVPAVDSIYLCLDNDDAGHRAAGRMQKALCEQYGERYAVGRLVPVHKDWYDDLTMRKEVQEQCPTLQM